MGPPLGHRQAGLQGAFAIRPADLQGAFAIRPADLCRSGPPERQIRIQALAKLG